MDTPPRVVMFDTAPPGKDTSTISHRFAPVVNAMRFPSGATEPGPQYSGLLQIVRSAPVAVSSATGEFIVPSSRVRTRRRLSRNHLTPETEPTPLRHGPS